MGAIEHIHARQILDSRGNPTVEAEVTLDSGAIGPRRGALGCVDGRVRGHRATRRRRAMGRQGRRQGASRTSTTRSQRRSPAPAPPTRSRSTTRCASSTARRTSRASAPTRSSRVSLATARACGGRERGAALPLCRRARRAHPRRGERAPGADDERHQRRRPRRQLRRPAGVHGRARRRDDASPRVCGWEPRSSTRSRRRCKAAGWARPSATRVASRPTSSPTRPRSRCSSRASGRPATSPGKDAFIALDPATSEIYRESDGAYVLEHEGRALERRGADRLLGRPDLALPGDLARGRDGRGGLGRLGPAHAAPRRQLPARRRRHLRHQPGAPAARDRARRRQLDPGQGEPDRDPDRDPRGDHDRSRGRLLGGDLAPLWRDRGHDASPTSPSAPAPGRSRPARRRARIGSPSTTSCCGSRRSSGRAPPIPGLEAFSGR